MINRANVTEIIKERGFYAPHIRTQSGFATIPEELINEIEIGDEVVIFHSEDLSCGGFSALVIETPSMSLSSK